MWWGSKKAAAERAALPGEILAAIEGVAMYVRHGDENTPRIVVQPVGWSGFIYSDDVAEKWIRKAYPELKRSHYREQRPKQKRESWMNRY